MSGPLGDDRDAKSKMTYFLQKFTGKNMEKGDCVFKLQRLESGEYQATLKVNCLDDAPEYEGDAMPEKKQAEQSAAEQLLNAFPEEIEKLKEDPNAFKQTAAEKRKAEAQGGPPAKAAKYEQTLKAYAGKSQLYELLAKYCKKSLSKEEIVFSTEPADEGKVRMFKSTVELPCVSDKFEGQTWTGNVEKSIKNAEHSAAEAALTALKEDPEILAVWDQHLAPKANLASMYQGTTDPYMQGKGMMFAMMMGKGGKGKPTMEDMQKMMEEGAVPDSFAEMMSLYGKGKKGKGKDFDKTREPVVEEPVAGVIHKVKRGHGFITPQETIEHERAKPGGKIYFAAPDVAGAESDAKEFPEWVKEGALVTFTVYADGKGLGAENMMEA